MRMDNFLTFQEFETREDAAAMAQKLEEHGIPAHIEQNLNLLDQNIIGRQYNNYILLKIAGKDFERAQKLLIDTTRVDISQVEKGYMLLSLRDSELMDVLAKPDEWGAYNYNVALAILKERGVNIDDHKAEALQQSHLSELSVRRTLPLHWIIFGYGFSVIGVVASLYNSWFTLNVLYSFYLLPGILGIILGLVVRATKKTLPNGTQIYSYEDKARRHGLYMLLAGIASLAFIVARGVIFLNNPQL